jgi:peptide/nickel transport system substrate-binding protein
VTLREGVVFHDGSALTSADVKAVMDAVMSEKNLTSRIRSYFVELESYAAVDGRTLTFRWRKPYFAGLRVLLTAIPVMPAKALEGEFNRLPIHRAPVGTGPFRFTSWEPGRQLTFERFDRYWGAKAHLDRFVVRPVNDATAAVQLWEQGAFDLMTQVPPSVWRSIESKDARNAWAIGGYHRIAFPENNYSWIGWSHARFPDVRVRKALALLYPYETVEKQLDLGLELQTTCPYYRLSSSCDPTIKPLRTDPAAARKLLAEAGWSDSDGDGVLDREGKRFEFSFLSNPSSAKLSRLLPLLQEELRKAGIAMHIENVEPAVMMARLREHQFDAAAMFWSNPDVVKDNYQVFHSSQAEGGSNYVGYKSDEVDSLLERIRVEMDADKRAELERQVHRHVFEDQVYTFLTTRPALDAVKRRVRGMAPSLLWYDLRKVWIAE